MPERAMITVRADALPPEFAKLMQPRPLPSARVRVTLEVEEPTPQEWLESVRSGIDKGRAEIAAGLGVDGETALKQLHAKHFGRDQD